MHVQGSADHIVLINQNCKITFEGQRLQLQSIATLSPFVYALPSSKDMQVKGLEELERKLLS